MTKTISYSEINSNIPSKDELYDYVIKQLHEYTLRSVRDSSKDPFINIIYIEVSNGFYKIPEDIRINAIKEYNVRMKIYKEELLKLGRNWITPKEGDMLMNYAKQKAKNTMRL